MIFTFSDNIKAASLWIHVSLAHSKQTWQPSEAQCTTHIVLLFFLKWMWMHAWLIDACLYLAFHSIRHCGQFVCCFTLLPVPSRLENLPYPWNSNCKCNPYFLISDSKNPTCPQNTKRHPWYRYGYFLESPNKYCKLISSSCEQIDLSIASGLFKKCNYWVRVAHGRFLSMKEAKECLTTSCVHP